MKKEKLKTLIKEYKEISEDLANIELREIDSRYENKKEEAEKVGKEADKLNKNLDDKYNEIMEFIEEAF